MQQKPKRKEIENYRISPTPKMKTKKEKLRKDLSEQGGKNLSLLFHPAKADSRFKRNYFEEIKNNIGTQ